MVVARLPALPAPHSAWWLGCYCPRALPGVWVPGWDRAAGSDHKPCPRVRSHGLTQQGRSPGSAGEAAKV